MLGAPDVLSSQGVPPAPNFSTVVVGFDYKSKDVQNAFRFQ